MTAGKGIMHCEMLETESIEGLQLWVNLSRRDKMCEPSYQEADESELLKAEGDGVKVTIIAGTCLGETARTITRTPNYFLIVELGRGKTLNQEIPDGWNAIVYVLNGTVSIGNTKITRFQAGILTQNGELRVESSKRSQICFDGWKTNRWACSAIWIICYEHSWRSKTSLWWRQKLQKWVWSRQRMGIKDQQLIIS
ncbi:unnamed protein product [Blepharisma stoltei]|uniref:Pirin C-terminal domain-containing protein n=1 Tax=Blepharisma stoltei TaxID=1481888 RepID=A0AAU9K7N9_9CILI|nr:unnamed protein product [Blepharisma stoltei]